MSTLPPLAALRSFEAVARLGSVTLAAAELHVTHSAVSQQIKQLEDVLDVVLLVREGRNLRLTDDGRMYAMLVRTGLGEIIEATRQVRARPRVGELVIAVLPSFGQHWLLPRLPRFHARHPHYRVSLRASLDIQDLRQGLVDIGVRTGPGHWEGLSQKQLFIDEQLAVASPGFNGGRLPQTASEVMAGPLVRTQEPWQAWCQAAGVEERLDSWLVINDTNLILEAVRRGMGVTLTRRSTVSGALEKGELVQVTNVVVPYPYPHWLVWPERESSRVKQRDFTAWIEEEVAGYLAGLPPGEI